MTMEESTIFIIFLIQRQFTNRNLIMDFLKKQLKNLTFIKGLFYDWR